jgi:hypothetical protein
MPTNIPKISTRFETTPVANLSSGATSFSLATATDIYGNALSGLYGFSIDEGQATQEFFIGSVSGTTVSSIQAMTSGSDPLASMATGLQQPHRKSAVVKITDYPLLAYLREILNGNTNYTLDNILTYTSAPTFTLANQLINKAYADALAIAGSPNASTSAKGIVQGATAAQINSGTATGSTGAILVMEPDQFALSNVALAAAGTSGTSTGSGNKLVDAADVSNSGGSSKVIRANGTALPSGITVAPSQVTGLPLAVGFKNGTFSKNAADASTTQNIAHGLGVVPKYTKLKLWLQQTSSGDAVVRFAESVYNGTTQSSLSTYTSNSTGALSTTDNTFTLNNAGSTSTTQAGVVTFDATNIIITWTKTGSPAGVYTGTWEAYA